VSFALVRSIAHILNDVDEQMFSQGDLRSALEAQAKKMTAAIDAEPEENLRQADANAWAASLVDHFRVPCPELKTENLWMEPPIEIGVDVSRDFNRMITDPYSTAVRNYRGYRVLVHVPFEGEADVFKLRASTFSMSPPRGHVRPDELTLEIEYPHDDPPDIDATVNRFIKSVSDLLANACADIGVFNRGLEPHALQAIEGRRQRIEQRDTHLAQSKIPVRRSGDLGSKTYIPDVLVRAR
jgi:hypothetical protein